MFPRAVSNLLGGTPLARRIGDQLATYSPRHDARAAAFGATQTLEKTSRTGSPRMLTARERCERATNVEAAIEACSSVIQTDNDHLTLLIDEGGTIDGLRIDTDPQARLFWRKKAHLLALVVKSRYGEEGWECHDIEPSGGETAVGVCSSRNTARRLPVTADSCSTSGSTAARGSR